MVVIEHHGDVIREADWVIDMGPGAGDKGGDLITEGTPEDLVAVEASLTGRYLKDILPLAASEAEPMRAAD